MCLELFNPFLGLPFAWLALALFAGVIASLAALFLLASPNKDRAHHQSSGFTCPCYAPPVHHPKNEQ